MIEVNRTALFCLISISIALYLYAAYVTVILIKLKKGYLGIKKYKH